MNFHQHTPGNTTPTSDSAHQGRLLRVWSLLLGSIGSVRLWLTCAQAEVFAAAPAPHRHPHDERNDSARAHGSLPVLSSVIIGNNYTRKKLTHGSCAIWLENHLVDASDCWYVTS